MHFATNICKKGLFLSHTSDRNHFFGFLVHFLEVPKFVGNMAFFLIKPGMDLFSTLAGGWQMALKLGFCC